MDRVPLVLRIAHTNTSERDERNDMGKVLRIRSRKQKQKPRVKEKLKAKEGLEQQTPLSTMTAEKTEMTTVGVQV